MYPPESCLVLGSVEAGRQVGLLLLGLHEGLLGRAGLLGALLHHALHAGQRCRPLRHAALHSLHLTPSSLLHAVLL